MSTIRLRVYNRRTLRARAAVDGQLGRAGWSLRWAVARYEWYARDRAERLRLRWAREDAQ